MKSRSFISVLAALTAGFFMTVTLLPSFAGEQQNVVSAPALREMIKGLGYEIKDLNTTVGKEKYEFVLTRNNFDLPIAAEISESKNYVWLTLFLGEVDRTKVSSSQAVALLNANFKTQPSHFYITDKNNLMIGLAIDNRDFTPALLRARIDKIADDCTKHSSLWTSFGK